MSNTNRITNAQAIAIFMDPRSANRIAKDLSIPRSTIFNIRHRRTFAKVTAGLTPPERDTTEAQHKSKVSLTDEQAAQAFTDPRPAHVVAEEFGVARSTIANIRTGRSYRWATEGLERG